MNDNEIKQFVKERNDAVWSFNVLKFKKFMKKWFPDKYDDLVKHDIHFIRGVMAKMAMNITTTPTNVMIKAIDILTKLGLSADIE